MIDIQNNNYYGIPKRTLEMASNNDDEFYIGIPTGTPVEMMTKRLKDFKKNPPQHCITIWIDDDNYVLYEADKSVSVLAGIGIIEMAKNDLMIMFNKAIDENRGDGE